MNKGTKILAFTVALSLSAPVLAGWKLVDAKKTVAVTKSGKIKVTPNLAWNKTSERPTKRSEMWTRDGFSLNQLYFLAEVLPGEPLFKQRDKKDEPLPKFKADMLQTDLVDLYEGTFRIISQSSKFDVLKVEPAKLGKHDAVRFQFLYVVSDEPLNRKGEVVAANIGGKMYMIAFTATEIEYFDRDIGEVREMIGKVVI